MCGVGFIADRNGASTRVLPLALQALARLNHRGMDGAGVMTEIPRKLLGLRDEAVGMLFNSADARPFLTSALAAQGLSIAAWREVPVDADAGPEIAQVFINRPAGITTDEFERRLRDARKESEERGRDQKIKDFYVVSLSSRTIVYKALVRATDLAAFYPDLRQPEFETSFALFHQRFSTNTLPSWAMTQPFRFLGHNGEINTISGNRSRARMHGWKLTAGTSDSASLDEAFEYAPDVPELLQSWEGPALVVWSDGLRVGAALDRNGLRPARYSVTADGLVVLASETGVVDSDDVIERGRVGPGGSVVVDLSTGDLTRTEQQASGPGPRASVVAPLNATKPDVRVLRAFGYSQDELDLILGPMIASGAEPLGSMGDDTPLAVLSSRPRVLFSFFKQRFAQVTNPPIDPLRESLMMSPGEPLIDAPRGLVLSLLFETDMAAALHALVSEAARAVRDGAGCLVLSDRGIDERHAAIPSLLAVSAVHQHLIADGQRLRTTITADSGEARDDHQIAALIAFGADEVCPWLAFDLAGQNRPHYRAAVEKGLLKILSKMGVSSMASYHGAQLFEAVGISDEVIDRSFSGTPSLIGGIGLQDIEHSTLTRHRAAFHGENAALEDAGWFRYRRNGEAHAYNPGVVKALHKAIASGEPLDYRSYARLVHEREPLALRDLLEFREGQPLPIDEIEPATSIVRRFMTAATSLGALSSGAQGVLAAAMNRLGARSNSGEGGEPPEVYGTVTGNRIKQVASGRFPGVTAAYLMSADELQIKIAQGSKPGEGGQLPGHKVTGLIARVRHATEGTTLISPPPHHDIYSIEDLGQLVYDLKRVNPAATVSVKLVSSAGIGTIAVGVAKAHADAIEISGHDGGTGASPLGSVKNAGTPWELGLPEVQQALMATGLRGRVRLQVNGGIKTGRDVVMAALLGAEEYGFGTAALVAAGCVMARQCHLNTCPVGIATQREDLQAKFKGTAEDVVRFFLAVAEEVREILALLGFHSMDSIIGRSDLLRQVDPPAGLPALRFDRILAAPGEGPRRWTGSRNDPPETGSRLDEAVLQNPRFAEMSFGITNADRSVGARIAGQLVKRPRSVSVSYKGTAGQSFGAFCVEGMRLVLDGEANDFVGKGMSGGEIAIRGGAGNTVLYGATGGRAFFSGPAGERFAVRNSGAFAVVEGAGDHACEYMTAGAVVILGAIGRNAGAGMSGGTLFVLDLDQSRINAQHVRADGEVDQAWLCEAIALHVEATGSRAGIVLLRDWSRNRNRFTRISPLGLASI